MSIPIGKRASNSLRNKLTASVILALIVIGAIIATLIGVAYSRYAREKMEEQAHGYIRAISYSMSAAIEFNDTTMAEDMLKIAENVKEIMSVTVTQEDGALFATKQFDVKARKARDAGQFSVHVPVINEIDEQVGVVTAEITTQYLEEEVFKNIVIIVCLMLLVLCVSFFFIAYLVRKSLGPLLQLKELIDDMSTRGFVGKVAISSNDEVGDLAASFNAMSENLQATTVSRNELAAEILERKHAETALQESQDLLMATLESTADGILVVDNKGNILKKNTRFITMWGIPPKLRGSQNEAELMEHAMGQLKDPDTFYKRTQELYGAHDESAETLDFNDGRLFERHSSPLLQGKTLVGRVWTFHDITQRVESEHERLRLEKELGQAQKLESIGTLAAGIAHEINTPVQFISDNTRFLKDVFNDIFSFISQGDSRDTDAKDSTETAGGKENKGIDIAYFKEEVPEAIRQTEEGLERVTTIVNAMKNYSHINQDERGSADINKAIESTVIVARNEWKYVADLDMKFDNDLPMVECYLADINQVVMNLVINATHAIKERIAEKSIERGHITIKTYVEGSHVIISIADTGNGIPEHVQSKIFDPFFTTKNVGTGTGQGLSIAYKSIVEKHEGRIWFETKIGEGTTFYISLPR